MRVAEWRAEAELVRCGPIAHSRLANTNRLKPRDCNTNESTITHSLARSFAALPRFHAMSAASAAERLGEQPDKRWRTRSVIADSCAASAFVLSTSFFLLSSSSFLVVEATPPSRKPHRLPILRHLRAPPSRLREVAARLRADALRPSFSSDSASTTTDCSRRVTEMVRRGGNNRTRKDGRSEEKGRRRAVDSQWAHHPTN